MNLKGVSRKSRKWLSAVGSIEFCVLCGSSEMLQVAHRNEGRGKGQKAPDWQTALLCSKCHHEIDNGNTLSRTDRLSMMNRAIVLTYSILVESGILVISDDNNSNKHC